MKLQITKLFSLPVAIGSNHKSQMPSVVRGELQMPSVVVVEESQITNANTGEGLNYK